MSHRRKTMLCYAAYVAGGALLTIVGPGLWNVHPLVASVAASATTLCFVALHVVVDTRQLARQAITQANRRRAELIALGKYVARIERRLAEAPPRAAPVVEQVEAPAAAASPVPEVASNLLQFAAHVSAKCARRADADRDAEIAMQRIVTDAVAEARVDLHLQPIVRLPSRQSAHYEALSRVRDRSGNLIQPAEFLPAAAAAGIAADLETQQLASVISLCNRIGERHQGARIFCNLSVHALLSERFRAELTGFMETHPALAQRIVFELHVTTAMALGTEAVADLHALADIGFAFSVDGASLANLAKVASVVGVLKFAKIDAADLIGADPNVIAALQKRGTQLIAVQVASDQQAVEMIELGIGFGQGFLFGEPRPAKLDGERRLRRAA